MSVSMEHDIRTTGKRQNLDFAHTLQLDKVLCPTNSSVLTSIGKSFLLGEKCNFLKSLENDN